MTNLINNSTMHFITTIKNGYYTIGIEENPDKKCKTVQFSVTQIYSDGRCVKKLVRSWQIPAAIYCYILLTQLTEPPQFQERARIAARLRDNVK